MPIPVSLLTAATRLAPGLKNVVYVRYTQIRGITQVSVDLKHLGFLLSVCFHLRANLLQKVQRRVPKSIAATLILANCLAFNQRMDIAHDMCKAVAAVSAVDKSNVILVWQEAQPVLGLPRGMERGSTAFRAGSMKSSAERT